MAYLGHNPPGHPHPFKGGKVLFGMRPHPASEKSSKKPTAKAEDTKEK
jgi:hypothetical protein